MTLKRKPVEGSHSSKVYVRSLDNNRLEIDGNPSKFLQGHNAFGSNDLQAIALAFFTAVTSSLGLSPSDTDLASWELGTYRLKRVDIAESFQLPRQADVSAWLRAASSSIRGKHQGTSAYQGETIYLGQHSRRISLKAYNKFREIKKHPPAESFPFSDELLTFAQNLLRLEVRILGMELKRRGLHRGSAWDAPDLPTNLLFERIGTIKMNQKMRLTSTELDDLPPRLKAVYMLWKEGSDLRSVYSKATFYRHRGDLMTSCGIDISVPQPRKAEVIPLVRYLTAEHVPDVPEWAVGTDAIFEAQPWQPKRRIS